MKRVCIYLIALIIAMPFLISAQSLIEAVRMSDTALVLKLIKDGADVNQLSPAGDSPLTTACQWGDSGMVSLLLENKASPDTPRALRGRTALMVASAYYSGTGVCKLLVAKGANVNAISESGKTALMLAARDGKKDVVEYLLSVGADASKKDIGGYRALDFAHDIDITIIQSLKAKDYNVDTDGVVAKLREVTKP